MCFVFCLEDKMTQFHCAKLHVTACYGFLVTLNSVWNFVISSCKSSNIVFLSSTETSSEPNWSALSLLCCNLYFFYPPGFVQFLQYYYQSGCLYRLRALGERNQLDLTVGALWAIFGGSNFNRLNYWAICNTMSGKMGGKGESRIQLLTSACGHADVGE